MKSIFRLFCVSSVCLLSVLITGCASIVDGGDTKYVHINSNPQGMKVTISEINGEKISVLTTPTMIALKRSHGYFSGEEYKFVFESPGYYPYETHITAKMDGWYIGNIFLGGVIGMLIVDPATGDMFTLPKEVHYDLVSQGVLTNKMIQIVPVPVSPPITTKTLGL